MAKLQDLLRRAAEDMKNMSAEQRREMIRQQALSYARAEAAFGSDADEAEYRDAVLSGDAERIAECERKSLARVSAFDALIATEKDDE